MRFFVLALSLLAVALLGACGLKGDLYLPPPAATKQPSAAPAAPQSAAPAAKAGDDSKASQ